MDNGIKEVNHKRYGHLKSWKCILALSIVIIFAVLSYNAGANVGDDIGEFIYNLTH